MARIWIQPNSLKVTKAGHDPRYATERDAFLFSTDWTADQIVASGVAQFSGAANSVSVALPPLYSSYKLDFFYWANVGGGAYAWPDDTWLETDGFPGFTLASQIDAAFSGGNLVFTRRGQIAGVSGRGVQYWLYSSAQP